MSRNPSVNNASKKQARKLFIEDGLSPQEIATLIGCSTEVVNLWKRTSRGKQDDWEEAKTERAIVDPGFDERRQGFFNTLFQLFEEERTKLDQIENHSERYALLDKYVQLYGKLIELGRKSNPKISTTEIITKTITAVAEVAKLQKNEAVMEFLSDELDEIKNQFFKNG